MAYAVKYVFTFQSVGGTTREIRILKDGYSGDPIRRALGRAPILKKQQNGPVHGTSLEMYAECHVDQEFIEFYTSDPKEYRVDLYAGNTLLWQGWITPELYSEPDIAPPYDVQVVATDGVGELKLYDFAAQGMVSLRAMLTYLLGKTGLSTDVFLVSSLKAGSAGAGALLDMEANFDYLVGKTCYEALSYLLTTLHATITWWGGHWLLVRENNVTFTSGKVRYFNTAGNSALLANSVQELGSMYQDPAWPVGQLSTVIDPAKNKVVVQAPWHPVTALQNSDMTSDASWNKSGVTYDSTKGAYFFARDVIMAGELAQSVAFGGLRVPMRMTLSGCGTSETGSGFTGTGNGWVGLILKFQDGDGNVYYLGVDGDGNRRWELYDSGRIPRAFEQDLLSVDTDRENADRIELDIPALAVDGGFPSGTLTVGIWGGAVYVFSAHLDVVLNKGYQDILHIDNGARGEGDDTEIAFGRVTSDVAYYQAFVQGILLNNGALITSFSDANFTTGTDYLSFISRDYARSVALPRARVEGTVSLEPSVQLPPLVFAKDGLDYWLETWSWNLYEDELQISARTLPTATLTVESETITEAGGSASTGSSSGGASSTPSAGVNYFEPNGDLASLIQLKPAYDYLGPRKGLIFGSNSSEDANVDLEVVNMNIGGTNKRVLHTKLPIVSDDFMSAFGASATPGASGIDADAMWQLLGASTAEQIAASHLQTAFATLNLGAAATYGIGQVASGNNGLVTGGAVWAAIDAMPEPMIFKGSLGTGGTITSLPAASAANDGFVYKVITDGTYRGQAAEVGDLFISNGSAWIWIPSGDEPSGTVTSVGVSVPTGFSVSNTPVTSSGTIAITFASGYSLPKTSKQTNWDTAYGWGNHATAGYLLASTAESTYQPLDADLTAIAGLSGTSGVLKKTAANTWALDTNIETYAGNGNTAYGYFSNGVLPSGKGGTGLTSYAKGDLIYASAANTLSRLAPNSTATKKYLTMTSSVPSWGNITFGDLPTLYIGNAAVQNVAQTAQNIGGLGTLTLANGSGIRFADNPAEGATAQNLTALQFSTSNTLFIGFGTSNAGYNTILYGNEITLRYGTSHTNGMIINSSAITAYRDLIPNTSGERDFGASDKYWKTGYVQKIHLTSDLYFEVVNGNVHLHTPSGKGLYVDGFVSAFGLADGGGGGGGVDPDVMWAYLQNTATVNTYNNYKIHTAHFPTLNATGGISASYSTPSGGVGNLSTQLNISIPSGTFAAYSHTHTVANISDLSLSGGVITIGSSTITPVTNVAAGTGDNADSLAVTKGGTASYVTVPYATTAKRFKRYTGTGEAGGYDLNTLLTGGGITSQYNASNRWANGPTNMNFGGVLQVNPQASNLLAMQFAWDVVHQATQGNYGTGKLWWRDATYHDNAADWGAWHLIYDDTNLTSATVVGIIGNTAVNRATGDGDGNTISSTYLKLSGGTMDGDIILPAGKYIMLTSSTAMLGLSSGGVFFCGPGTNATAFYLRSGDVNLTHVKAGSNYSIWDASNAYISSSAVTIGSNTVGSSTAPIGYATQAKRPFAISGTAAAGGYDLNTLLAGGGAVRNVSSETYWAHAPSGARYFGMAYQINPTSSENGAMQFYWDGTYTGATPTGGLFWRLRNNTGWADDWHRIYDSANANLSTIDWACNNLNAAGKVNVGAPSSTTATVNVAGTIWASTGIWSDGYMSAYGLASSSDKRLKDNIKDFAYTPELLMSLKPREWDWNGKANIKGHAAGFVAQEVEPHLPYAVTERVYKQLFYDTFHAIETSALQDHETRIKALEEENKQLKEEIKRLRAI